MEGIGLTQEQRINREIQECKVGNKPDAVTPFNTNLISDGYHTFGELYEHRIALFIKLCWYIDNFSNDCAVWRLPSKGGWFILGISNGKAQQMSYHLPESKWEETKFAETLEEGEYEFDGHTSADVLERLKQL